MALIPARPPGVFVQPIDDVLRERWERARRWLGYAFVAIPACCALLAVALTVLRAYSGSDRPAIAEVGAVAVAAALVTAVVGAAGLLLFGSRTSPSGRSVPRDPRWWIWAAGLIAAAQGVAADSVSRQAAAPDSRTGGALFPLLLALLLAACYCAHRAGRELTDPPLPALGDTDLAVPVLRESGRNVALMLEVLTLTVTEDRVELAHRVGRRMASTTGVGLDRLVAVWPGWAPPEANGVWNARPPGTAEHLPPGTPAVVLRTYDQDIFLVVDRVDLVAQIIHRRAARLAALRWQQR